jgi:hypothetical protein
LEPVITNATLVWTALLLGLYAPANPPEAHLSRHLAAGVMLTSLITLLGVGIPMAEGGVEQTARRCTAQLQQPIGAHELSVGISCLLACFVSCLLLSAS